MGFEMLGVGFESVDEVGNWVGLKRLRSVTCVVVVGCGVLWGSVNRGMCDGWCPVVCGCGVGVVWGDGGKWRDIGWEV